MKKYLWQSIWIPNAEFQLIIKEWAERLDISSYLVNSVDMGNHELPELLLVIGGGGWVGGVAYWFCYIQLIRVNWPEFFYYHVAKNVFLEVSKLMFQVKKIKRPSYRIFNENKQRWIATNIRIPTSSQDERFRLIISGKFRKRSYTQTKQRTWTVL